MAPDECRVLVVEDDRDCANSTAWLLERLGAYRVRVAYDPSEAHTIAEELRPHVVLMDVGLPGKDGYILGQELLAKFPDLKIIALSGYSSPEAMQRSIAAGFQEHLVKPADPEVVAHKIQEVCEITHPEHCPCDGEASGNG